MKKRRAKSRRWQNVSLKDPERIAHLRRMGCYVPPAKSSTLKRIGLRLIVPLKWIEKMFIEPPSKWLNNADLFNILEKLGFLFAAIIFITEVSDRQERTIFEAWTVVNDGRGEQSGVVRLAVERLHRERFRLVGINAGKTNLYGVKLQGADLRFAKLYEANLNFAKLDRADLQSARLQGAKLQNASLREANLESANLKGANLLNADLKGARFCKTIMPDGKQNNTDCPK